MTSQEPNDVVSIQPVSNDFRLNTGSQNLGPEMALDGCPEIRVDVVRLGHS